MKYDLKRLKNAVDERIPSIPLDEGILDRALRSGTKKNGLRITRAMTAFAACVIVIAVLGTILIPGLRTKPDDTGDGQYLLAQGSHMLPGATKQPEEPAAETVYEEDLSVYQAYSPDFAHSIMPDEATFGDVVIRRLDNYDRLFVFEEKETGERVIPGQFDTAFAYFPQTETGLVKLGPNEGLSLVNVLREVLDGEYSYFEYKGDGVAIVANRDEDETEPDNMYLISTADGARLSREYAIIGTMYSGDVRLMMGHDNQEQLGDFDVLDMDGRVIARVGELYGVYFDEWLAVKLPGEEEYCLIDFDGVVQLGGMRFSHIAYERDGMLIVWTDEGSGVIGMDGEWVFEPGRFVMIEFRTDGLFRVMDAETGEYRQVNAQGEDVDTWHFRFTKMMDSLGDAYGAFRESVGELGYFVICLTVMWLIIRLGFAQRDGSVLHMIVTELGFAAYIAGLLFIGHRNNLDYITIFPTDTSTEGARALAGWWLLAGLAATASLIAAYPKLRTPKKAFLAGYTLMLLPWAWKAICGDVSVSGWRAFSEVVFIGGSLLAVLLHWIRPVKRFMEWCARFDHLNEYGKWVRIGWWAVVLAALINFGGGCFISGQEMVKFTHHSEADRGATERMDGAWIDEVNRAADAHRESGYDEEMPDELAKENYHTAAAVNWLHENGLDMLDENMIYTVRMTGKIELRRKADAQLIIEAAEAGEQNAASNVWQIIMDAPTAQEDGSIEAEAVFLVPPGEELPDITAWVHIRQRGNVDSVFAAQYFYRAELGVVLKGGEQELLGTVSTSRSGGAEQPNAMELSFNELTGRYSKAASGGAEWAGGMEILAGS